jgi:hypothetical protein
MAKLEPLVLDKIANFLRNGKGGVDCSDGACFQRRVEFFRGDELVDCLQSQHFAKQKLLPLGTSTPLNREAAMGLGQQLLDRRDYFHGANWTNKEKAIDELYVLTPRDGTGYTFEDSEDAMYIWVLPVSQTKALVQSALFVVALIFLAAIKAWPIWMKVIVWWISLICLICLVTLSGLRLVLYSLFWLVGFRGIWLLPNMFNDDLDFLDAFYPLFGRASSQKELAKQAKQKRLALKEKEVQARNQAKLAKKGALKAAGADVKSPPAEEEVPVPETPKARAPSRFDGYNFGLINLCGILIAGLFFCNYMGLLMPEMIPDFVVSKQELFAQFPSLAPPDYNASAEDTKPSDEPAIPDLDSILREEDTRDPEANPHTLTEELDEEAAEEFKEE